MALGPNVRFVVGSLTLCVLPVVSTLLAVVALVLLPQGAEVLKTITDQGFANFREAADDFTLALMFLLSLLVWSAANWYSARLLMQSRYVLRLTAPRPSLTFVNLWRSRFPRTLIPIGAIPIVGALASNHQFLVASAGIVVVSSLLLLVVMRRRMVAFFNKKFPVAKGAFAAADRLVLAVAIVLLAVAGVLRLLKIELGAIVTLVLAIAMLTALACRAVLKNVSNPQPGGAKPIPVHPSATALLAAIPEGEELSLWLGGSFAFVVVFTLSAVNYSFARWLGGVSILLLALSAITVYGSLWLIYLPRTAGWPALTGLAVAVVLAFAFLGVTANHGIAARRVDTDLQTRVDRPEAAKHYELWREAADSAEAGKKCEYTRLDPAHPEDGPPIFLIAAEGGASRSAWWSAHVLTTVDMLAKGCLSGRVFAVSGISGGSLGVAAWVAMQRERREQEKRPPAPAAGAASQPGENEFFPLPDQPRCEQVMAKGNLDQRLGSEGSSCFLGRDYVAPVLGYMLGVDLLQRAFPIPVSAWDRSLGLENTWTLDWRSMFGTDAFGQPLVDLYRTEPRPLLSAAPMPASRLLRTDIPVLLLSTATVDRGRPAVQAPIRINDAEIDDLLDARLSTAGLTLAGAVHNSARFPYVSPGGDVKTTDGAHFDSVVDGGYIENSGALALAALMRAVRPADQTAWNDMKRRIYVVFIANGPTEPVQSAKELCVSTTQTLDTHERHRWDEVTIPPVGLFNARSSRADVARRALMRDLDMCDPKTANDDKAPPPPRAFFISMATPRVHEIDPVMSWYMTPAVRRSMWSAVAADPARGELLRLAKVFKVDENLARKQLARFDADGKK